MTRNYAHLPQMNMAFSGAKLAILLEDRILVILRDARADIPFPGFWDLPGGGREGGEDPLSCALRETREELGLTVPAARIGWGQHFGSADDGTWFFVARLSLSVQSQVRLGDEGQRWEAMRIDDFLTHERVVPHFRERLFGYFEATARSS